MGVFPWLRCTGVATNVVMSPSRVCDHCVCDHCVCDHRFVDPREGTCPTSLASNPFLKILPRRACLLKFPEAHDHVTIHYYSRFSSPTTTTPPNSQMASVSGACVISKVSGLLQIREDTVPSKLMWKAIDQDKSMEIPLNNLSKLQASPDSSPKMLLKLFYTIQGTSEIKDIKLTFNNRLTMNAVKETLQTIVARQKTVIKDSPAPGNDSNASTPAPTGENTRRSSPTSVDPLDFSNPESLSDANLLKNRQLQQKLLLEDKTLRSIFTQSVINFKLSPAIFWSTRTGQLRTYALTISQHRGPYNVLSAIKPVATSDNQVNVNVTRDTINEIFGTYPIIRHAFDELVPVKLNEGEFWSRFFNSKLFRRLRGDKINTSNTRGDVVIDKYLYVDAEFVADEKTKSTAASNTDHQVNKFIDLEGNEEDNSQKLGILPDFTMKFSDNGDSAAAESRGKNENEMMILMKNMNKLSNKMINAHEEAAKKPETVDQLYKHHEYDLNISDLTEAPQPQYVPLHLDTHAPRHIVDAENALDAKVTAVSDDEVCRILLGSVIPTTETVNLNEAYASKSEYIAKANADITASVKHNFRTFKQAHNLKDPNQASGTNVLKDESVQELITYNITVVEFLLHFWNLFLNGGSPVQLKKLFTNLRNCQSLLVLLEQKLAEEIQNHDQVKQNERLRERLMKDLGDCVSPLAAGLNKACNDYMTASRAANQEVNENGKRPLEN